MAAAVKDSILAARMTPAERQLIETAAAQARVTVSTFVRTATVGAAGRAVAPRRAWQKALRAVQQDGPSA